MNALKNFTITAMAAILTSCSYAQSGFTGKSWSAGTGFARLVNLPLTDRVVEHWSNPDGSRLLTSFSLRQTLHWQLSYGQHQAINRWLDFKWMVHVNSWGFLSKEQLRYQEPLIQLPTPSNRIPPIQMTTYRSLTMWSVSALPGLFAHIPLGGRVGLIMSSYAGLMTTVGNIYPDEQLFYRHHAFNPAFTLWPFSKVGLNTSFLQKHVLSDAMPAISGVGSSIKLVPAYGKMHSDSTSCSWAFALASNN